MGGWLPGDPTHVDGWIRKLKKRIAARPRDLVPPIKAFQEMVYADQVLHRTMAAMFAEAYLRRKETPLGTPEVRNFEEFLVLLNGIMTTAPEYYECEERKAGREELEPCGLIGFPINALLDWPMGTVSGYDVFANSLVNQQFKKILSYWSQFLVTQDSRYVLVEGDPDGTPVVIPWLSETAKKEMVDVACSAVGEGAGCTGTETFQDIFNCKPQDPDYGFQSWDDFFTRTFVPGVRPVTAPSDDRVIVNACESAPFALRRNVSESAKFWIKGQPYSLENMLEWDPYTPQFVGGTVYQAFLSALSYHRWHSPVSGTVKKAYVINGSYYLENMYQGFKGPGGADDAAPNDSQAFLTAVATRALIFIEADNPDIGLMCVMPVGMAEVSSCQITVCEGDHVVKGQQLGMFHFGGSTHCLIFRPGVELDFHLYGQKPGPDASTNIRINTAIATVKR
ncbi:phosphatidylserine decarboxylase family protein [Sulfidibacter corallicola]|uniref:Phosphatidylserine decarboxylase family protein n=1 Tax=Sulfidibacter corallicola TaxID=2818388 RepID=A0A8A4TIU0_SULCO|nr:phosphatidylserine decarboxylase family protein [Sulfidibacter corallicola]QTD49470.1 phosphatidylserine decarboxylase family protein [Sulfidibacter corallicola]